MMKSNRPEIRNHHHVCRCTVADHRRAALVALCRAAMEVDELRDALHHAEDEQSHGGLDDVHAVIEQIESRLYDEGRALHVFDDEYECSCAGHASAPAPADAATFDDEDEADDDADAPPPRATWTPSPQPLVANPRWWRLACLIEGIGVGCTMAAQALRLLDNVRSEEE